MATVKQTETSSSLYVALSCAARADGAALVVLAAAQTRADCVAAARKEATADVWEVFEINWDDLNYTYADMRSWFLQVGVPSAEIRGLYVALMQDLVQALRGPRAERAQSKAFKRRSRRGR